MCETRSAVSMLEKCTRKPSRNPYTSMLLQCLAWDKFHKKYSGGWERWLIPVNWNSGRPKSWRRTAMTWLCWSCQIPAIPMEPGETSAASAFPTLERGHDMETAVTLHKVLQFFMARSIQGPPCFPFLVLSHNTKPRSSLLPISSESGAPAGINANSWSTVFSVLTYRR